MSDQFFVTYFERVARHLASADLPALHEIANLLEDTSAGGRKVIVAGNGGSAAMASHVAVDLTKTAGIRAVTFNESDLITCFANDYGYEHWIERAIEAYADAADTAVLVSSSGKSTNIINAALKARQMRLKVVTLSGFSAGNPLRQLGDFNLWVDSSEYNIIEMVHHTWLLAILDKIVADAKRNTSTRATAVIAAQSDLP